MKYCPYCGADLIEDAVSFCAECGKQLPAGKPQKEKSKEKPEIKKIAKKKKKKPVKKLESSIEDETVVDDGYDGYYDDVRPVDEGHELDGVDKELIKKIAIIIGVLFVVIIACVALGTLCPSDELRDDEAVLCSRKRWQNGSAYG